MLDGKLSVWIGFVILLLPREKALTHTPRCYWLLVAKTWEGSHNGEGLWQTDQVLGELEKPLECLGLCILFCFPFLLIKQSSCTN